jgi:hypothetical protein
VISHSFRHQLPESCESLCPSVERHGTRRSPTGARLACGPALTTSGLLQESTGVEFDRPLRDCPYARTRTTSGGRTKLASSNGDGPAFVQTSCLTASGLAPKPGSTARRARVRRGSSPECVSVLRRTLIRLFAATGALSGGHMNRP